MSNIRPYLVTDKKSGAVRLIQAASQSQARNFVAKDQYTVITASANDVIDILNTGVRAESVDDVQEGEFL